MTRSLRSRLCGISYDAGLVAFGLITILSILLRRSGMGAAGLGGLALPWNLQLAGLFLLLAARGRLGRRSTPQASRRPLRTEDLILCGTFFIVLAFIRPTGETLGTDGPAYLAQLKDFFLGGQSGFQGGIEPGTSLLWAPFFGLGHVTARWAELARLGVAADGTSAPYRNALRLGSAVYGLLAALFAQRAAARFVRPRLSAVCVGAFWLGSTLFHYTVSEPLMAHAPASAISSLLVLLWLRARESPERLSRWVGVGLAGGLLVSIQRYDVYLLLPPFVSGVATVRERWKTDDRAARRRTALAALGAVAAFVLAILPLVVFTLLTPGHFLLDPGIVGREMLGDWRHPHLVEVLWSSNGGLFAWTPVALLGALGLALLVRRDRVIGLILVATMAVGVYVLASNPSWWAGWSFGARRLTEAFPVLALGFCVLAETTLRHPRMLGSAALASVVVLNVLLSGRMQRGLIVPEDVTSLSAAVTGAITEFYADVGHPGSWPANWAFAMQYGVSPDRFDLLYGRVPRDTWSVRLGTPAEDAILGRGWSLSSAPASEGGRWAAADDATLLVTLTEPSPRRLRLLAAAARHPEGRPQVIRLDLNGRLAGQVRLDPENRAWEIETTADSWRTGINELRFKAAWPLSRKEAWAVDQPPFVAWRLVEIRIEPAR